jgi:hypothetical protein
MSEDISRLKETIAELRENAEKLCEELDFHKDRYNRLATKYDRFMILVEKFIKQLNDDEKVGEPK